MAPPDCVHVETTQHTIEERVKMPTVNEPFELCVLPPFDVTRDTVRIMFANCAMLHGTIQRCDDKFVVLATDNSKCNDKSWMIFTKNILTKDVLRMTHLFLMALKSQFKGKLLPQGHYLSFKHCCTQRQQRTYPMYSSSWLIFGRKRWDIERHCQMLWRKCTKTTAFPLRKRDGKCFRWAVQSTTSSIWEKRKNHCVEVCVPGPSQKETTSKNSSIGLCFKITTRTSLHTQFFFRWSGKTCNKKKLKYTSVVQAEIFVYLAQWLFFAPHWNELWGVSPGSSCGKQPSEPIRSSHQKTIYTDLWKHNFDWSADGPIGVAPRVTDPSLLHGTLLPRVGRTTTVSFATRSGNQLYHIKVVKNSVAYVGVCRTSESELDLGAAVRGLYILCRQSQEMQPLHIDAGILTLAAATDDEVRDVLSNIDWPHQLWIDGNVLSFHNTPFRKLFIDIVYVVITT